MNSAGHPRLSTNAATDADPTTSADRIKMVLIPARIFLALGWTRAAVEKTANRHWWSGREVRSFLADHDDTMLSWLRPLASLFMDSPVAMAIAVAVIASEFVLGALFLSGRLLPLAVVVASSLNIAFIAFGAVTPSAFYLVLQITIGVGGIAQRRSLTIDKAVFALAACVGAVAVLAPSVRTLHPQRVIEDPAIMLITIALLVATTLAIMLVDEDQLADG